jgi:hypothetical protein
MRAVKKQEVESAYFYKFYSSFGADINLLTEDTDTSGGGSPCRRIIPFTSGNIVVTRPDGTNVTITGVFAGQVLDIQAKTIVSASTTITSALVCW